MTAAKLGHVCVLDNLDQIKPDILSSVLHLLADAHSELPDGSFLTDRVVPQINIHKISEGFQLVAIASLDRKSKSVPAWLSHNLSEMFSFIKLDKPSKADIVWILKKESGGIISDKIITDLANISYKIDELGMQISNNIGLSLKLLKRIVCSISSGTNLSAVREIAKDGLLFEFLSKEDKSKLLNILKTFS